MSNTYKIPYTRYSKRGVSELISITAISAAMAQAESLMINSNWIPVSNLIADLPLHSFLQSGFEDSFDSATFCGDYAFARQRAYACAVCYTIKIPDEAQAGTIAEITSITASLYGDRWASAGAIIAAIPSALATPPAWSAVLSATATSPDPVTEKEGADPTWQAPLRKITRSNDQLDGLGNANDHTCTVTLPVAVNATPYLHVVLRMGDYATHAGAWIEGGVMLDGTSLSVSFDRAVSLDDNAIIFENDFSNDDTSAAAMFDASYETVNLTHSAGVIYNGNYPAQSGNLSMMRRIIAMRNVDSMVARHKAPDGTDLGFGVCDSFSLLPGRIGTVYELIDSYDVYKLFGVTLMRGTETDGGIAAGISFDAGVAAFPAGQIVRVSFYGITGMLPSIFINGALIPQYSSFPHSITKDFVYGNATSFFLNVGVGGGNINSGAIDSALNPFSTVSLKPLGFFDTSTGGIESGTAYPFSTKWDLPSHAVIVVTANVLKYTSDWVAASQTSTAETWEPNDITLHLV